MRARRGGFSLLEVLLAVVILGMSLAAFFSATSQGLAIATAARQYETARTLLNQVDLLHPMQLDEVEAGEESGSFDGEYRDYRWKRIITEAGKEEDLFFHIETRIEWGDSRNPGLESVETYLHLPTARRDGWVSDKARPSDGR